MPTKDPNVGNDGKPKSAADREVIEVLAENERLRSENADLKDTVKSLEGQLRAANDLIDSHTRGSLIAQIQAKSDYGIEYLSKLTADQLRDIIQHFDHVKAPKALMGHDTTGDAKRESLSDVYGSWKIPVS